MIPYLGVLGAGGGGAESVPCGTRGFSGRSQRVCISLQPARADASSETIGSPKVLPGTAKGGLGDPAQSPEENLGVTLGLQGSQSSVFEFPGGCSIGANPAKLCSKFFFPGSAAVAAGHLVCPTSEIAHLAAEGSRIPPYVLFGGIRANRLASNFKTPPALAISHLAVYRAP